MTDPFVPSPPNPPDATDVGTVPPPAPAVLGAATVALGEQGNEDDAPNRNGTDATFPSIPGYELLSELGRGGMGVVYKARQVRLRRVVALKMILSGGRAGPAELARFRVEAEAVARLQHPHIVQLHEVGEHDGLPFFSLEFCNGGSLDRKLQGKPLPGPEAAELVELLGRAMHYAHGRGVVHRDLKPANILLVSGESPSLTTHQPKITDFGLAKRLDEGSEVSRSGSVVGTPSYMAPEQAEGRGKDIGPAAD